MLRSFALAAAVLSGFNLAAAQNKNIPLDAYLRGGRIHYQGGRFERAKEQFANALEAYGSQVDNVKLAEIYVWLGLCEAQLRDYDAAAGHMSEAIESDSTAVQLLRNDEQSEYWAWTALINAARQAYGRASYDTSLTYAMAAIKVDPGKSGTYALLANSYNAMGRYEDMLATARQMLQLDAESPEGLSLVGLYYLEKPDSLWAGELKETHWDSCATYYNKAIDIYEKRFKDTRKSLGDKLRISDSTRLNEVGWALVERSRKGNQEELKNYIEKELGAAKQLAEIAQIASQLFYAANNMNVSSSRAGSAMLRAATDTQGDVATRFRAAAKSLFETALVYDPVDVTAKFNLAIVLYQSQEDSLASVTFQEVIDIAVVPLDVLPEEWQEKLLGLITADAVKTGNLSLEPATAASVDSILSTRGYSAYGYSWLYFPELRNKPEPLPTTPEDGKNIFLSLEAPHALESIYLLLGVTRTSMALSLAEAKQKDAATAKFNQAIENLHTVISLNPENAEAYQNLVHCYRETDQKKKAEDSYKKYKELSQ